MDTHPKTVALLIDGDNAQHNYTSQIIQYCETQGSLRIKKAYGDWKQPNLSPHRQSLRKLGIELVQQDRDKKDATDIKLKDDVSLMLEKSEAQIYVIVSSDSDFKPAYDQIRKKGAVVIGIGGASPVSKKLRQACDKFIDIQKFVAKQDRPVAKSSPLPQMKSSTNIEILLRAYQATPQQNGWVYLAELGKVLRQLDKQFDERFANKTLSSALKDFPHKFEVTNDRVRMK